jgi:MshEN domain
LASYRKELAQLEQGRELAQGRERDENIPWVSVHKSHTVKPLRPKIGEMLLSEGKLSEDVLTKALRLQGQDGKGTRLGAILLKWDLVPEQVLLDALSKYHRCPSVDREALVAADKKAVSLLSPEQASRLRAMPYAFEDKALRVAFENPSNLADVDEVGAITGRKVLPAVTSQVRLVQAHQRFYRRPVSLDLWSVVQKLERKATMPPPPPRLPAPDFSEPLAATLDATQPAADMGAPAELATAEKEPPASPYDPVDEFGTVGVGRLETSGAAEAKQQEPDPFADDCPLTKFVEDALTFFAKDADLEAVLETLVEPVEDLDPSTETEEVTEYASPSGTDSTVPRSRPGSSSGLSY